MLPAAATADVSMPAARATLAHAPYSLLLMLLLTVVPTASSSEAIPVVFSDFLSFTTEIFFWLLQRE